MKKIIVCALLVIAGCSTSSDPEPSSNLAWSHAGSDSTVVGKDETGNVRARFDQTLTTDADGTKHGLLTAEVDGRTATMEFVVSSDGHGRVLHNDIPEFPEATRTARAALGAMGSSSSLAPRDLVVPQGPLHKCIPSLIGAVCIVAALCGLGGEAGSSVLEATVEAGTEQCE